LHAMVTDQYSPGMIDADRSGGQLPQQDVWA
jgi:hypothetical protein